ncbi:MAG: hypothetical protein ACE5HC_02570 [Candidatus Binatia bacterium]
MKRNVKPKNIHPRRQFLAGVLAGVGGVVAWLWTRKAVRAAPNTYAAPSTGPILYRRTEEAERYYKTLYK